MAKGFRAQVLADLLQINRWQRYVVGHWHGATRVLDPGALYSRKARPEELPENDVARLRELERYMLAVMRRAEQIGRQATARIAEIETGRPR